jgi:outer membrane protein OmpA-like peptidoglycan-associated protein
VAQPPAAAAGRAAAAPAPSATAGAGVAGAAVAPPVTEERLAIGERTADARLVSRQDGRLVISHDDEARLALTGGAVDARPAGDGRRIVTVSRGDGSAVVTLTAADGSIIRRSLRRPDGSVLVLIDGAPDLAEREPGPRALPGLPPPDVPRVPAGHADVAGDRAAAAMIAAALAAPPPGGGGGAHALVEVLQDSRLRDSLPAVDIDTLDFDPGSATLPDDQIGRLAALGQALADIIRARPDEVFLIEGHTDAPGSGLANLVLSDRRAEAVAEILTRYDKVPPENLVTQGYGAEYLKVPTEAPEPASRRITVRRITPLLGGAATTE